MPETPFEPPAPEQLSSEEREIAALFRSAGAGDRVPDGELQPIKAKAREAWRRQVRLTAARRGAGRAVLAIAAAVVLTIAVALLRRAPTPPSIDSGATAARLQTVMGDARIDRGGDAAVDAEVASGSTITTGDSGRAALLLASGHSVRIDVESSVQVVSARSLRLDRGAVYVEARAASTTAAAVEIATPFGVVTDVGTRFEVRLIDARGEGDAGRPAQALEVRVRDGAVRLTTDAGSYEAGEGTELRVERSGTPQRDTALPYGDDWRWVESVRPPVAVEGITLGAFLDWASRESGRLWRFAEPETRDQAEQCVIHGSIEGLTVDEALSTFLPSCGFRHRVDGDVLVIEPDR
jgi:hypothetical protein